MEDVTKKPYAKSDFTPDRLDQLLRCIDDPIYFMESFVKVQHPKHGQVPFKLYDYQKEMVDIFNTERWSVMLTARQMGKALCLETPIMTPEGFKPLGEIKVGDTIYGQDGEPTTVTFITEIMRDHACYNVNFAHGETILADAEHQWTIRLPTRRGEEITVTTEEMISLHAKYKSVGQSISIRHCEALNFSDKKVDIDPYMFGVWLGDGNKSQARVTCHIDDYQHYADAARLAGYTPTEFRPDKRSPATGDVGINDGFRVQLRALGALGRKHIPDEMIFTSKEKRLALLQGLMDTDGSIEKNGVARFYQSDEVLAKRVRLLLSTLGIKSTIRRKPTTHKDLFIITFSSDQQICSLPRKVERLAALKNHAKNKRVYIKSIEAADSVPVRCLQVNNRDHLFLAGETLVVTHNTATSGAFLLWKAMFSPDTTILIAANTYMQALEIMDRVRYAYENLPDHIRAGVTEYNKGTIKFDNGSKIVARATSPNAGRGLSITLLYLDEFAFVPNNIGNSFFTAMLPTLSAGGQCIITSTPKSDEDQFATIYKGATDLTDEFGNPTGKVVGRNGFRALEVTWDRHPERDEEWGTDMRAKLGDARFEQEMCCRFVSDDPTLIDSRHLSGLKSVEPEYYTGRMKWFHDVEPNLGYLVALDPAMGIGPQGDNAAIQVYTLPGMTQVAEWQHNATVPKGQVKVLLQTLVFLDQTLREDPNQTSDPEIYWTVENNSIGEHILGIIEDTGEDRFPGQMVSERKKKGQTRRFRKGLNTDNKKKVSACAKLKSLIESGRMTVNSRNLIRELKFFVSNGISFKAKPGEHDDLVCATLLAVRMLEVVSFWGAEVGNLKEYIDDDEIYEDDTPLPNLF